VFSCAVFHTKSTLSRCWRSQNIFNFSFLSHSKWSNEEYCLISSLWIIEVLRYFESEKNNIAISFCSLCSHVLFAVFHTKSTLSRCWPSQKQFNFTFQPHSKTSFTQFKVGAIELIFHYLSLTSFCVFRALRCPSSFIKFLMPLFFCIFLFSK